MFLRLASTGALSRHAYDALMGAKRHGYTPTPHEALLLKQYRTFNRIPKSQYK